MKKGPDCVATETIYFSVYDVSRITSKIYMFICNSGFDNWLSLKKDRRVYKFATK